MAKLERVVVGYDFSPEGEVALAQGLAIAKHAGAELVLAHVGAGLDALGPAAEQRTAIVSQLRQRLAAVRARVSDGARVTQVCALGEPDEALVTLQRELGAELLVVGSHGRSGIRWLVLGSVAERVARTSPAAVLVARGELAGRGGYRRILAPTDFSAPSVAAVELAIALAAPRATIELLHCWQVIMPAMLEWGGSTFELAAVREDVLLAAERRGREVVRRYEAAHPGTQPLLDLALVEQPPRQGIHRRLESGDYDLVALGSRGHRGLQRWVLGSVAESIVRHAPCSVLISHGAPSPRG